MSSEWLTYVQVYSDTVSTTSFSIPTQCIRTCISIYYSCCKIVILHSYTSSIFKFYNITESLKQYTYHVEFSSM